MIEKIKNIKIDKYFGRRLLALCIIALLIIIVYSSIFKSNKISNEFTVLYNNEKLNLKDRIIVYDNDIIYFSKEDVRNIWDSTIFYNETEKELITTYNKHIALLKVGQNNMLVNDANIEIKSSILEIDNKIYLPINELLMIYDIELNVSKENNKIIIDSFTETKIEAKVSNNCKVKTKTSLFSKSIEKLKKDDIIYILEDIGKYKKVKTQNGNIGYIKAKKVYDEKNLRDKWQEEKLDLNILEEYSNITGEYEPLVEETKNNGKLNSVFPEILLLEEGGKVINKGSGNAEALKNYTNWANENNISVIPVLKSNTAISKDLLTYEQRNKVINELYDVVVKNQVKGINIDFETINDVNSFYRFIIEITPKFKESGLKVCVTLNKNINRDKIENIVDYIIEEKK